MKKIEELLQKIKEFLRNKPITITLAIPSLIIVIYVVLLFLPTAKQLIANLGSVARTKAQIANTAKEWEGIDSFKAQIARLNEKIDFYEKKLPQQKEIPAILGYLSDAARRLNVRITEIKPIKQVSTEETIYYSIPILLKAECRYHQLGRFLNELEKADRFMKINDLKVNAAFNQEGVLQVQLMIVTYAME